MQLSRRTVLAFGGALSAGALSGCTGFFSEPSPLSLTLLNFDSTRHEVTVEATRRDAETYQEAVALREQYELPPPTGDDVSSELSVDDVLESDGYVVTVALDRSPVRATYQFYPALADDPERDDRLFIEVRPVPDGAGQYFEFQQNH
ncbi:hypothetical protein NP511_00930 [Natrinema thermotolerans]|uniref:Uncharacterized protein n=1 Tax=Natrinema thermotolerans TaxID=121872 RepID=A0AAF0PBQ8_9EURY|nr:hypothetical protein [Natrinema thermotolerans]ELZ09173.1 hypothetical protein C478_17109 [Natrinema thermotolerans DSM 11552]QCC60544.1 hypothetical protein DVR14_18645 [Natrinema thermotolerans]QCC61439.1 hypothetical protein DVR14_22780 [Natrinema thermotolerans]WMT07583.1 hypothetical protein NP511_19645 [Natrinema thermotolerans]WMT08215.1 hypothetical protein NP511_00930 [Natrinema thermotolerans]